jgi:hypothetical protein
MSPLWPVPASLSPWKVLPLEELEPVVLAVEDDLPVELDALPVGLLASVDVALDDPPCALGELFEPEECAASPSDDVELSPPAPGPLFDEVELQATPAKAGATSATTGKTFRWMLTFILLGPQKHAEP